MKRLIATLVILMICVSVSAAFADAEWTYDLSLTTVSSDYALLVNRDNLLESDYVPANLVNVDLKKSTSSVIQLDAVVAAALETMFADAALVTEYTYLVENDDGEWEEVLFSDEDGLQLLLESGYRSYSSQYTIYYNRLARNDGVDDGYSAPPGASEHQTGYAADVISVDYDDNNSKMNSTFYQTPEAQWMEEYCAAYGFIIRYEEDTEDITGYNYEPWHLRYVGREIAGYMKRNNLTLEEFTEEWQAALQEFLDAGGDVDAQLLLEATMPDDEIESYILDELGEDGDNEVSLTIY